MSKLPTGGRAAPKGAAATAAGGVDFDGRRQRAHVAGSAAVEPPSRTPMAPREKRQRTRTGRGLHDRFGRDGCGPDAGSAVSPSER
eukprot:gene16037-biopygen9762